MKILVVHNAYQQRGGEDVVVEAEVRLLERRGERVIKYTAHNDSVNTMSRLTLARRTVWNGEAYAQVRTLLRQERPDVMHVHNTLPLISPSVYHAAWAERVPVVQTLHNYRLICPAALFFRDGHVCTECAGRAVPFGAITHACCRDSRAVSATVVSMVTAHRVLGTWRDRIAVYIALTEMARRMFVDSGLPTDKFVVKPHFVDPDPGRGDGKGGYALFVGRLSAEKGVRTLLEAWRTLGSTMPLTIVGDGPLADEVAGAATTNPAVSWLGARGQEEIPALMRDAACLVFPSECYETFGRVIVEAYAAGTPVIAAGHGAAGELVRDGVTGLHFGPGDAEGLAAKVRGLFADPDGRTRMRHAARQEFETRYTAAVNHESLIAIYKRAIADRQSARS